MNFELASAHFAALRNLASTIDQWFGHVFCPCFFSNGNFRHLIVFEEKSIGWVICPLSESQIVGLRNAGECILASPAGRLPAKVRAAAWSCLVGAVCWAEFLGD